MSSTSRDKELARQRAERQAARQAAHDQRRKQRRAVLGSVLAVTAVAGAVLAGTLALRQPSTPSDSVVGATTSTPATQAPGPVGGGCSYEKTGARSTRPAPLPPVEGVETGKVYAVTLATNRGDIVFRMDSAQAPCTANSLRSLAGSGYFDATTCHRLTTQGIQVLQCGDPTGSGTGGPGYQFADENLEGATYPRGTVAMANAGPGTNGSQFFLVYGDSSLSPDYTPFGEITSGLDVLDAIAEAGSDDSNSAGDGKPRAPVTITTVRVKEVAA